MKLLLALMISVFSLGAFAQGAKEFDLSGSKVNIKLCKSIEAEIQSLSKDIIILSRELEKLRSIRNPSKDIIAQIKKLSEKIEALKNRLARLSAFYEKHCKKEVVDCDKLNLQIADLEKVLGAKKDELSKLITELRIAEREGNKRKIIALKAQIKQLNAELQRLNAELNRLRELYKKHCS